MTTPGATAKQPSKGWPDWLLPTACCCAAAVLILIPFFMYGTASGHDFEFHAASWLDAANQWKQGIEYPRWTEWANYGYGEPRFIFYPPLSWMLGAALTLVLPGVAVPLVFIVLVQTLAGLSAYLLLRRLAGRRGALLGALFYTVNPNALLMTYIRSDFAEQLACALFPLLLLAALQLCESLERPQPVRRSIATFAVVYAGIWLCNAPAGVIASYAMAFLFGWAALTRRSWLMLIRGGAGLALGLALACFYLLPAAYEQRWVNIGQALSSGLLPWQNFLFTAIDDVEHTWFNWIASICALALILILAFAALLSRRFANTTPKQSRSPFGLLLATGTVATLLMMRFTLPLWNHLPKLRFVQFPWRWMSMVALVAMCFLAAVVEKRGGWIAGVLVVALAIPLGWFLVRNTWWDTDEVPTMRDQMVSGTGFDGTDEYDPLGDDHMQLAKGAPEAKTLAGDSGDGAAPQLRIQIQKWTAENKQVEVESPDPARIVLRLLNYPAWKVEVNGKTVQPERLDDVNAMVIPVEAGSSTIRVRFTRTADRMVGNVISLLAGFLTLLLFWNWDPLRQTPD